MAITVGLFGVSGDGKSTSMIVNPDGKIDLNNYNGMNPETTVIFNCDEKVMPFPARKLGWEEGKNIFTTSKSDYILSNLKKIGEGKKIKSVVIDTINGIMLYKEMVESKKPTYDKWMDLARDIYEMIHVANGLRDDLVIYFTGHVALYTDVDGNETKCLVTNGKKLEKIKLESKLPIVLYTSVVRGMQGDNKYEFETQKNRSTGKSPVGMFSDFNIPNSMVLVDKTIREYYGI